MDCKKYMEFISLYIDNMLSEADAKELEAHISKCESCKNEYEAIKSLAEYGGKIAEIPIPEGFHNEIMRAVRIEASLSGEAIKIKDKAKNKEKFKLKKDGKRFDILDKIANINRRYIYGGGAVAACLIIAVAWAASMSMGMKSGGASSTQETAAAPMAAPAAEMPAAAYDELMYDMSPMDDGYYGEINNGVELAAGVMADSAVTEEYATEPQSAMAEEEKAVMENSKEADPLQNQKIIKTAYYDMEVSDFAKAVASIQAFADASGGYIESYSSYVYSSYGGNTMRDLMSGNICLKVPSEKFSEAKVKLDSLGKVISTSENIDNITSQYVDTQARLSVKEAEEDRLLALIAKADKIEDLIALETRLTYVRSDIEAMMAQLKSWDRSVSFSTININITEVVYDQIKSIDPTLSEKISQGFTRSVNSFLYSMERMVISVAENIIAIFIFFIIALFMLIIISTTIRKRRGRNEKN